MAISYSSASYLSQFMPMISSTKMNCLRKTDDNQQASCSQDMAVYDVT